ncbi:MAG: MFS transporter, partial [Candidatus Limnocylindrales bacterium]
MTPPPRLLSGIMLGLAGGAILVPLNSTMLAVALPSVTGEFGLGANTVSSLVTLYLGAVVVALPASGSIGDRIGHRNAFLLGVIGFALSSLLAALAGTFIVLEAGRVGQAVAGALISTSSAALLRELAPPERRGEAFGLFGMLVSTSAAIGPLVGGLLVAAFGWRSLFFVAVPVALLAASVVGVVLRPRR